MNKEIHMKRLKITLLLAALALTGCGSSKTISTSYKCPTFTGLITVQFHENGYVDMGMNGDILTYEYKYIEKNIYEVFRNGRSVGFIGTDSNGLVITQTMSEAKGMKTPCKVEK